MAQSLDEAVFGIHLLRAIYYCKNQIPAEKLYHWKEALFLPMEEFLRPQVESIHNISLWIQCCIGMIGVVFDENAITQQAITGPFGLEAQMQSGLTDDYLWREGSLHYHYYALEALTFFCELYRFSAPRSPLLLVMAEMYRSPLRLSYDGYHLPSLNDGWYPLTLSSYAAQIIKAAYITQDSALLAQKQTIYQRTPELFRQSDIKVLEVLFEEPGNSHVLCFQDHIAILQAPFFIALKSGSSVSTHAHKDVLSIVMDPFSRDLGTPGYGSPITKSWYRNSLSHNTISMDGTQNGSLLQNKVYLHANSSSAPEPCLLWAEVITSEKEDLQKAYRTLSISADDTITDHSVLITEKKHIFDWTFHSDCPITHNAQAIPATSLGEEKYYSFFSDIQEIHPSAIWEAYLVHDKEKLQINISFTPGMHIYLAKSPGNPSTVLRNTLILRQEGTCCDFTVSYRVIQNKAPFCAHTFFPRKKERLQKS